jgi:hypothetical protein
MSWAWTLAGSWLLPGVLSGGLLLLVAGVLGRFTAAPARRQRLGEWAVAAALAAVVLSLGPRWLSIQVAPLAPPEAAPEFQGAPETADAAPPNEPLAPAQPADWDAWAAFVPIPESRVPAAGEAPSPVAVSEPPPTVPAPPPAEPIPWLDLARPALGWLGLAHAAGAVILLSRWVLGHVGLRRLLRSARPVPPAVLEVCRSITAGRRLPRLLESGRVRGPLSCGLLRPTVVLPASLCGPSAGPALRWVLAHELTHLERRDVWGCLLFALGEPVFYALPWFWWLRRQARLCREYVADSSAAALAGAAEDYAQFLLSLTAAPAAPAGALGVTGHTSDLFRRIAMLLRSPGQVEKRPPRLWSLGVAAGLLSLAALVAGVGFRGDAVRADEPAKGQDVKRDAPKKEPAKKEEEEDAKKKKPAKDGDDVELPDIDALLKNLPAGLDPEAAKAMREAMKRQMDMLRKQFPNGLPGVAFQPFGAAGQRGEGGFFNQFGQPHEGRLGVMVKEPSEALADQLDLPKGQGVVIERVEPDSAAAKAGLKANDILLQLDGKTVSNNVAEVIKMIHGLKAKTPVEAVVMRKGKKETVKGISLPEAKVALERPGFPNAFAPAIPNPPVIGGGGFGGAGGFGGFGAFGAAAGNGVMTTVFRTGDRFTARHQEGNLVISVTGTVADGKATTKTIAVQDGNQHENYESMDKVPEQYRDKAKSLVEMGEKGAAKVEIK